MWEPDAGFGTGAWGSAGPRLSQVSSCARVLGAEAQEEYLRILDSMCQKLKSQQYNGSYFDRGAEAGSRLCTQEGWFSCQVSGVLLLGQPWWPEHSPPGVREEESNPWPAWQSL